MIRKRLFTIVAAALCLGSCVTDPAVSQSYPERLVKIIVPAAPGGPSGVLARVTVRQLQAAVGQNVIVENIAGGGGIVAAKAAARATNDGYTLLLANTSGARCHAA